MTYSDWRNYGYVSRLSCLRCGPSTSALESTAGAQSGLAATEAASGTALQSQALSLEQPLIAKEQALSTGNRSAALSAAMPSISNITAGYQGAKESIFNTVAPGAARDTALANLETQKAVGTGTAMATQVQQAPEILANVGQGLGAFSLQEVGAGLSGYQGASGTQQAVLGAQTQQQAAKLGVIGSLAGGAGEAAGGGAFGKASDRRLKTHIRPLLDVLGPLGLVIPVRFTYRSGGGQHIGVIAQEIQQEFPEAVSTREDGMLQVDYGQLAAVALEAAKELHELVRDLSKRVEELEKSNVGQAVA